MEADNSIQKLENELQELIEHIRLLEIMVCDFQPQSQNSLNQQINSIITGLQEIQGIKANLPDVQIPKDLIEYIDKGLTPEIYLKDYMDKCLFKNEEAKNRVESLEKFKNCLISELSKVFPSDISKYQIIRNKDTKFE